MHDLPTCIRFGRHVEFLAPVLDLPVADGLLSVHHDDRSRAHALEKIQHFVTGDQIAAGEEEQRSVHQRVLSHSIDQRADLAVHDGGLDGLQALAPPQFFGEAPHQRQPGLEHRLRARLLTLGIDRVDRRIEVEPHRLACVSILVSLHHGLSGLPAHRLRRFRGLWPIRGRHAAARGHQQFVVRSPKGPRVVPGERPCRHSRTRSCRGDESAFQNRSAPSPTA
mmetsp:Transcript_86623/g.220669  ORF Transcript_86623/g.220669 Transcript_86623/m.220669 type:complete len:223 (+) Transcript_86623:463-1131(+)